MPIPRFTACSGRSARLAALAVCLPLAGLLALGGCAKGRPLHKVLADADDNFGRQNYAEAVPDYATYVDRRPEAVEARYRYGVALIRSGQPREAIEQLTICTDVFPLRDDYTDALAEAMYQAGEREALQVLLARATTERGRVFDFLRQARYATRLGNLDEARQALLTASKLDQGRSWQVQREIADFYGAINDRPRQVRRLRMAYFLNPDNPEIIEEARRLGEVPGPTFGIPPEELRELSTGAR
ncbi:MAG: tetratricopeptide repeat protein [Planctomycetota bacterium]|nr:tetratricopeptide repeat protein [Planctomycetota bacterium]